VRITAAFVSMLLFLVPACPDNSYHSFSERYNTEYLTRLLTLAKTAIREEFDAQRFSAFQEIPYSESQLGVFIRIINNGWDRGCVGFYRGVGSIEQAVCAAAVNAAFFDGRYPTLRKEELATCELEITVSGELEPMTDAFDFDLKIHMLRIELDDHEAMLQPQIAQQYGYDKAAFLRALCRKAGMEEKAYLDANARLFKAPAVYLMIAYSELE